MKYIKYILLFFLIVSCSKNEFYNEINNVSEVRTIIASFEPQTKSYIDGLIPKWENGDNIWISNGTNSITIELITSGTAILNQNGLITDDGKSFKFSTDLTGDLYAVYPSSSATGTASKDAIGITIPAFQDGTFTNACICTAESKTTSLIFKNSVALFKIKNSNNVHMFFSTNKNIAGDFNVNYSKETLTATGNNSKTINGHLHDGNQYFAVAPSSDIEFETLKVKKNDSGLIKFGEKEYSVKTILRNNIYFLNADLITNYTEEYLGFSISDTEMIRFATGNLYYKNNSFYIESNQCDYRHYNNLSAVINGESTTINDGSVGSFYWSNNFTIASSKDYSSTLASSNDYFFTNATSNTPNSKFSVDNEYAIWRTLSSSEYEYLKERTYNNHYLYGLGVYNDIKGLIILPDTFDDENFVYCSKLWENNYNSDLEKKGAIFIPALSGRIGEKLYNNETGFYWISNPVNSTDSYQLKFYKNYPYKIHTSGRGIGAGVRLVRE